MNKDSFWLLVMGESNIRNKKIMENAVIFLKKTIRIKKF
jgi:hypothetical protein